jgi:hypothetical protein
MKLKTSISLFTVLTVFIMAVSSCKKEDAASAVMTDEEAAEAISLAVSGNTEALSDQVTELAAVANVYSSFCSYSKDTSITRANTAGAYTWNYLFKWNWAVACTSGVPNSFNANYKMKGTYDAPRMSSADSAVANLVISNLTAGTQYTYNGNYTREGSQVSKIRNKNTFTSKIVLNLSNLKVSKTTGQIDSGTATASITGSTTGGNSFNYGGTVTFTGSKTATITLNSGGTYAVSW